MAHKQNPNEKVIYVGDSRIRKREHNPSYPADYSAYPGKSEAFVPNFLLKEWMVGVVVLVGFLVLVISEPAPLGYPANPLNGSFIPVPDWYFLFLYQMLKYPYASGSYVGFGVVCLSGLPFIALLLAPFLDSGKERRFYRRPIASSLMLVSLVAVCYLTWVSWDHYQSELRVNGVVPEDVERVAKAREAISKGLPRPVPGREKIAAMVAADDPAFKTMQKAQCIACHGTELEGGAGPALRGVGDRLNKQQIHDTIMNGRNAMPSFKGQLSDAQISEIATWLEKQKAGG